MGLFTTCLLGSEMQGWEKVFHIKASRICNKYVKTLIWKDESSYNLFCFTYTVPFILQIWFAQEILNVKYVRLLNFTILSAWVYNECTCDLVLSQKSTLLF